MDVLQTFFILVFKLLCKVGYDNEEFIRTPTFTYNKVMQLH
jgi:hypothetical protein